MLWSGRRGGSGRYWLGGSTCQFLRVVIGVVVFIWYSLKWSGNCWRCAGILWCFYGEG